MEQAKGPDFSVCELESIEIPGAIQPHGALLACLAEPPWHITHASTNLREILGMDAAGVLGQPLQAAIGGAASTAIQQAISNTAASPNKIYRPISAGGRSLHLQAHRTGRHICVDIEPVRAADGDQNLSILASQSLLETLRHATSSAQLCMLAVNGLRTLCGYDRVLALRFADDEHGEVIAESRAEHLVAYLGLHYRSADVPARARRLYLKQRVGSVADTNYQAVPLLADAASGDSALLDLTYSSLRSISPVALEYARDMGTVASVSIALVSGQKLWGMLLCHHTSPRVAAPELRAVCDLLGQVTSMFIGHLDEAVSRAQLHERSEILDRLVRQLSTASRLPEIFAAAQEELLGLVGASGVAVHFAGSLLCFGRTPPPAVADLIFHTLRPASAGDVIAIEELWVRDVAFAAHMREASGVLLVQLDIEGDNAIIWFRPENPQEILWAGAGIAPTGTTPASGHAMAGGRAAVWKQALHGRSAKWTASDQAVAGAFGVALAREIARRQKLQLHTEMQRLHEKDLELAQTLSELQKHRGQLDTAEMRFERARSLVGLGAWEYDIATGEGLWSKDMYKLRGISPGDIEPSPENALAFTHPDDREERKRWIADMTAGVPVLPRLERIIRPDGEERTIYQDGAPVLDATGKITHLAGIFLDVTERVLAARRLAQAQQIEALGYLTGGMAHDFNNLLGVITVNLDLLKRVVGDSGPASELCAEALDGARRCADLVANLLAFARRQSLHPEPIDVRNAVTEAVRAIRPTLSENIRLELDLGPIASHVIADRAQFDATLLHLATNAREAMPNGGMLRIAAHDVLVDSLMAGAQPNLKMGAYVNIKVSDTGCGIPPELLGRIYDPFFSTKKSGLGTGLGLSVAFGFAKQSGGQLVVYSEVGIGTTFQLFLPRSLAPSAEPAAAPPHGSAAARGETVLVVDDNKSLRRAAVRQLIQLGYNVRDAENAVVALEILSGPDPVDLLFTDVAMPGPMDGVELARRAMLLRPALRVLLTSGFFGSRVEAPSGANEVDFHFLLKPYGRDKLARAVRDALDDRAQQ